MCFLALHLRYWRSQKDLITCCVSKYKVNIYKYKYCAFATFLFRLGVCVAFFEYMFDYVIVYFCKYINIDLVFYLDRYNQIITISLNMFIVHNISTNIL